MIQAFIAAIGNTIEVLGSKYILSALKVPAKTFLALGSALIFFFSVIIFIFFGHLNFSDINFVHGLSFLGILIVGFFYNYLYYSSLKKGNVCEVEPLAMIHPLLTMLLAVLIYPDERNMLILIPAFIAGAALTYSRIERHHLKINKYSLQMLGFVLLISIESILVKYALEVFSPVALYTFRIGILSVLFLLVSKPNLKKVPKKAGWGLMGIAAVVAVEYIAYYTAIEKTGLVITSLIFLLAPVSILFGSKYLFREKFTLKKAVSDAVIILCIAAAIMIKA